MGASQNSRQGLNFEKGMKVAIEQAKRSLREGNNGFGAIIIWQDRIITEAC